VATLDPDVVFRADTGGKEGLAPARISGAAPVAEHVAAAGPRFAPGCRLALVNGAVGLVVERAGRIAGVTGFTIADGRIVTIDVVLDRDKLQALRLDG
jgi:hypothetical protein